MEGKHPEVFAANGSHGVWGGSGKFQYSSSPDLSDFTSRGIAWRLWFDLVYAEAGGNFSGTDLQWLDFQGRWGNDERKVRSVPQGGYSIGYLEFGESIFGSGGNFLHLILYYSFQ